MCECYRVRIAALAERARRARGEFVPSQEPPDRGRAIEYLRDGVAPAIAIYRETRMQDEATLSPLAERTLVRAFRDWVELYAACFDVHLVAEPSLDRAATLVADGATVRETVRRISGVPGEPITRTSVSAPSPQSPTRFDDR